jgi:hypothetical protein
MDFVELPEHLNCSFTGTYSPVILRVEAIGECDGQPGGFIVEEFLEKPPHVTIVGNKAVGRFQFGETIKDLLYYLGTLERHELIRSDLTHRFAPGWFLLDQRHVDRRISLFGTGNTFEFHPQGKWDRDQIEADLKDAYRRLKAIFERFYDTKL